MTHSISILKQDFEQSYQLVESVLLLRYNAITDRTDEYRLQHLCNGAMHYVFAQAGEAAGSLRLIQHTKNPVSGIVATTMYYNLIGEKEMNGYHYLNPQILMELHELLQNEGAIDAGWRIRIGSSELELGAYFCSLGAQASNQYLQWLALEAKNAINTAISKRRQKDQNNAIDSSVATYAGPRMALGFLMDKRLDRCGVQLVKLEINGK